MAGAVQRAHDRTIEQLDQPDRDRFVLQLIRLVEANQEIGSVPLRLR
jgi:hypothetical protein